MFLRIRPYEFPERSFLLKIRLFYSKTSFLFLIIFHYQKESKYSGFGDFCQNETSKRLPYFPSLYLFTLFGILFYCIFRV